MISDLIKVNGYNPVKTLLLREYWENRRSILITPIVVATFMAVMLLGTLIFQGNIHMNGMVLTLSDVMDNFSDHDAEKVQNHIHMLLMVFVVPIGIVMWFAMIFTTLSSLYDERKDNSILFWKSMPISDTQTIVSKLLTVTVTIPIVAILVALALQIFILIVASIMALYTDYNIWSLLWAPANLPLLLVNEVILLAMYGLWALPVFAWFMLASVISKRTPLLVAIIPMVLASLFERVFIGTHFIGSFFNNHLGIEHLLKKSFNDNFDDIPSLDTLAMLKSAADPQLWFGLAIAAALLYGTILLRRRSNL